MSNHNDDYAGELEAQGKALERRAQELEGERQKWKAAVLHYVEYLRAKGRDIPAFVAKIDEPEAAAEPAPYDGVTRIVRIGKPRIGPGRRILLLHIAKATRAGRKLNSKQIIKETGLAQSLVVNAIWSDVKRGVLKRADHLGAKATGRGKLHEVVMTDQGFEILRKAGLDVAND
jgi:hypothetical protein